MYFIIDYTDAPDTQALRAEVRPLHRAHIYRGASPVRLILSGPTELPSGETGAMLVVEADALEAVQHFTASDPYVLQGVVAQAHIRAWNWTAGCPTAAN
jgi:uncharacterized protein YciI